ncbi:hypothetical protein ACFVFS_26580 [Kitasatospora sp. NPDC057692]|uniref:hypothetical protein n=1 Tax=Kitasatospora sp. NPDC057692 TaxID=3346215 RepID=UPI0036847F21
MLEHLAAAHLLNPAGPDRYRLHDLLRCYAAERAAAETGPADLAAARERLRSWYLQPEDQGGQDDSSLSGEPC